MSDPKKQYIFDVIGMTCWVSWMALCPIFIFYGCKSFLEGDIATGFISIFVFVSLSLTYQPYATILTEALNEVESIKARTVNRQFLNSLNPIMLLLGYRAYLVNNQYLLLSKRKQVDGKTIWCKKIFGNLYVGI